MGALSRLAALGPTVGTGDGSDRSPGSALVSYKLCISRSGSEVGWQFPFLLPRPQVKRELVTTDLVVGDSQVEELACLPVGAGGPEEASKVPSGGYGCCSISI